MLLRQIGSAHPIELGLPFPLQVILELLLLEGVIRGYATTLQLVFLSLQLRLWDSLPLLVLGNVVWEAMIGVFEEVWVLGRGLLEMLDVSEDLGQ